MPTEDRPAERQALEAAGLAALHSPETRDPLTTVANRQPIVRLWHDPAFFAPTSWTAFAPARPPSAGTSGALVRRVRWDRPHDLHRFFDPLEGIRQGFSAPPTVHIADAPLATRRLMAYLRDLRRLPIPIAGLPEPVGLDGESWGFQVYGHFLATQIHWWGSGPPEWAAFIVTFHRLHDFLAHPFEDDSQ